MADLIFSDAGTLAANSAARQEIAIRDGRLCAPEGSLRRVDCRGYAVLPGIVDAHGDGFERHLAPRRGAVSDLREGLLALDAELAANGITTAVLAQFWSWEGGMRGPDFARALAQALAASASQLVTRMVFQLRLELCTDEGLDAAEAFIAAAGVRYVVFNDHLPHSALSRGKQPPRLIGQALKAGRSPETHLEMLHRLHAMGPEVEAALPSLCARLSAAGVRMGSHDDATADRRQRYREMGVQISEFPETEATAKAARDGGDAIVLGAPNLMRGGSHNGNVSAEDMVRAGMCDALASDYHYPSLRQAAYRLLDAGYDPDRAWALVSSGPAGVLGLADRGHFRPGAHADLVVIAQDTRRIEATFVGGRVGYACGMFAERLIAAA
ncbi:MAG: alpha-D-ribose 1-methylphosphonate 5-triphosphate diphosphatase [Dinoroseobacter sp.]|nr:alpha-D-ribose 1-methylphosphonate 5-triphosphate diphosphatase [Dinoroseobacter sp.]